MPLTVLGLIPARGGSRGFPGKNIAPLGGLPVIAHSIRAAAAARRLTRTIVSTDDPVIAETCRRHGADVPFLRPAELARDDTPTLPVLLHALAALKEPYDAVMILQPTSPLRLPADIDAAVQLLERDPAADSVISVVAVDDNHPARMKRIEDGVLVDPPFAEAFEGQRRQDLPPLYLRNGAIYLTRTPVLTGRHSIKGDRCLAYVMPRERSINIDQPLDIVFAEALIARQEAPRA